jgi:hypothetical protein
VVVGSPESVDALKKKKRMGTSVLQIPLLSGLPTISGLGIPTQPR